MTTTITDIQAIPLTAAWSDIFGGEDRVPPSLRYPAAHFTTFPRRGQYATLVRVVTSEGTQGVGEAWGLPLPSVTASLINDYFRPFLIGRNAEDIEGIWASIHGMAGALGHTRGFMMEALSGVDIALWDCLGKMRGKPLAALLGGSRTERIAGYASPVTLCEAPADSAARAKEFVGKGFTAIKVKAGRSVEADLAHLAAIRTALGPDIRLLVDFNCSYDAAKTIAFAREAAPLDIYWLEEPLPPEQIEEMAAVRRRIDIPVAAGRTNSPRRFPKPARMRGGGHHHAQRDPSGRHHRPAQDQRDRQRRGARLALHGVGAGVMLAASLNLMSVFVNADLFRSTTSTCRTRSGRRSPGRRFVLKAALCRYLLCPASAARSTLSLSRNTDRPGGRHEIRCVRASVLHTNRHAHFPDELPDPVSAAQPGRAAVADRALSARGRGQGR